MYWPTGFRLASVSSEDTNSSRGSAKGPGPKSSRPPQRVRASAISESAENCSFESLIALSSLCGGSGARASLGGLPFEYHAILHHKTHLLQYGDVGQRIAGDCDQVGIGSGRHGADLTVLAEELCRARGRGLNGLHRRHAELDLAHELLGDGIGPGKAADVSAEGDLDPGAQRLAERHHVHLDTLAVALAAGSIRRVGVVVINRKRRYEPGALLKHLRDLGVSDLQPVLD